MRDFGRLWTEAGLVGDPGDKVQPKVEKEDVPFTSAGRTASESIGTWSLMNGIFFPFHFVVNYSYYV